MTLSSFAAYIKQLWRNKPDTSTPVTAERLAHMEEGIKGNSDAIEEIAAAVVSQIINDPDKIASMAAVYAVNQKVATLDGKVGDTAQLPDGATDVVTAIAKQNSDLARLDGVNISAPMIGTVVGTDKTEVKNNTLTTLYNFSLDPGIYICEFQLTWSTNATGSRRIGVAEVDKTDAIATGNIRTSYVQAVDGDTTRQHLIFFVNITTTTKYAVRVQQFSGTTLTTALRMALIKLKDV